jgi:hypothetical protein
VIAIQESRVVVIPDLLIAKPVVSVTVMLEL